MGRLDSVRELMIELASADAEQQTINHSLFVRSATYQQTLSQALAAKGCVVSHWEGGYRVMAKEALSEGAPLSASN